MYVDCYGHLKFRGEATPVHVPHSTEIIVIGTVNGTKKAKIERIEGGAVSKSNMTHGELLTIMMENIIRRTSSYSTILLADALRKLITPSFSVILLRTVMLFVKGMCAPLMISLGLSSGREGEDGLNNLVNTFTNISTYTGGMCSTYGDEHVHRAVTWAEAILDSHFTALAFRASNHAPTRRAIGCVMDTGEKERERRVNRKNYSLKLG